MEWLSNFGMREWLISCGIILVLVVLFDGFRRMRAERKGEIKMALRMGGEFPELPDEEPSNAELPNGGARVINRDEEAGHDRSRVVSGGQVSGSGMDAGAGGGYTDDLEHIDSDPEAPYEQPETSSDYSSDNSNDYRGEQHILVMHAKSRSSSGFNGSDLLQILLACDLRYGERDILHRHERAGGEGQLQFSVANMVEPGVFNLEDIGSFRTPGVTFFMTLPGADELEEAFDCMLETANCLAKNLDADLLDDRHNPLTQEKIEDCRRLVRKFALAPVTA